MASTNKTPNYDLPQFISTDKPSWLGDINSAFLSIDTDIKEAYDQGSSAASQANAASEAASAASEAAKAAQDAAEAASSQVGGISTIANQALSQATAANTTASQAKQTADSASTVASTAQQTATSAASAASAAQATASGASTTAQEALTKAEQAISATSGIDIQYFSGGDANPEFWRIAVIQNPTTGHGIFVLYLYGNPTTGSPYITINLKRAISLPSFVKVPFTANSDVESGQITFSMSGSQVSLTFSQFSVMGPGITAVVPF